MVDLVHKIKRFPRGTTEAEVAAFMNGKKIVEPALHIEHEDAVEEHRSHVVRYSSGSSEHDEDAWAYNHVPVRRIVYVVNYKSEKEEPMPPPATISVASSDENTLEKLDSLERKLSEAFQWMHDFTLALPLSKGKYEHGPEFDSVDYVLKRGAVDSLSRSLHLYARGINTERRSGLFRRIIAGREQYVGFELRDGDEELVWSGKDVQKDEQGYLGVHFCRKMERGEIVDSGLRISPSNRAETFGVSYGIYCDQFYSFRGPDYNVNRSRRYQHSVKQFIDNLRRINKDISKAASGEKKEMLGYDEHLRPEKISPSEVLSRLYEEREIHSIKPISLFLKLPSVVQEAHAKNLFIFKQDYLQREER